LLGGFLGAQKQWGNWVLGVEGDIDGADIKGWGTANASFSSTSGPNLTFESRWGFPPDLRCASLAPCALE